MELNLIRSTYTFLCLSCFCNFYRLNITFVLLLSLCRGVKERNTFPFIANIHTYVFRIKYFSFLFYAMLKVLCNVLSIDGCFIHTYGVP